MGVIGYMVGVGPYIAPGPCGISDIRRVGSYFSEGIGSRYPDAHHIAVVAYNPFYIIGRFYKEG